MITDALSRLSELIAQAPALAPLLALLAGVLTAFTPCHLSTVPLVVAYVGGGSAAVASGGLGKPFRLSLTFAAGMAVTFTALGVAASLLGKFLGISPRWWYLALGVLMVLMALQTWELFTIIPATYLQGRNTRRGYLGALAAGVLGGLFSSPCATPVLVALLAIVAGKGSLPWGILLMLCYAAGSSVLVVFAGTSAGLARRIATSAAYGKASAALKWLLGGLILLAAFYLFYLAF